MIDNVSIFFGRVEDVDDPLQCGRIRVRVFGAHTQNTSLIPTDALPWSHVSTDVQDSAIEGLGWSPTGVVKNATVWGFYLDPETKLEPFVVGAYHGLDDATGTHDVNPLARGVVSAIMQANKAQFANTAIGVRASNNTSGTDPGQSQGGSSPTGAPDPILAAKNDISAADAANLATVKLTDSQVAILKQVCGSDTLKYNFMVNVLCIENRGNPGPKNAVSPKGASGPFQLMPATAKAVGLQGVGTANDERGDFGASARGVSTLYDDVNRRYSGNRPAMYADYNGGPTFGKAVAAGQYIQNTENRKYVAMAMYLEGKETTQTAPAAPAEVDSKYDPEKWMTVAQKEIGNKEYSGTSNNNPRILEYHAATSLNASNDETPWCSAFACWVFKQAGIQGTRSALARSWINWGYSLQGPKFGAIVVVSRGNNPAQGHVGFVSRFDADTVWILGGNQKDSVNVSAFKRSSVIAYRWPSEVDEQTVADEAAANPTWSQPVGGAVPPDASTGAATVGQGPYPWNRVYQSRAGHVFEIDDTPGNARLNWYHMSGTFREILNEGTLTDKSVQDRYTITTFNAYELVGKNLSLTVEGTAYYRFKGDAVLHSDKNLFLEGGSRIQMNSPLVAFSEQIAAPMASFAQLDVTAVIEGTCKNALWAAQAGSIGGAAQAVINKNIVTAMEASVKAAQEQSTSKYTTSFGPTPPSALTAREGDIWVPTGVAGTQQGQQIFKDGKWVPDNESKVRIVPTSTGDVGQTVYYIPESDKPVTVVVGNAEPLLTEAEKAESGHMWVNALTGAVKQWAPIALTWAAIGLSAKVYSDDTNNVGGQPAGVVASKAIDGYEKAVQALSALAQAGAALDGQVNTFFQDDEPNPTQNPGFGDYWFDTDDGLKMYIYALKEDNTPYWKRDESEVGVLLKNLSGLQTGKSTTYFQTEDPSGNTNVRVVGGDIWFHPTQLLLRRWDGSQWVLVKSSGDSIEGGTITNTSITTNKNETEERLVIDSDTNSTTYYAENDTGVITPLARTGGTEVPGVNSVQKLGSTTSSLKALELESSSVALTVKGEADFNGPVVMTDVLQTTKPVRVGSVIVGGPVPIPAAASYPFHMMTFRTTAATPVVIVCYSDGVNWRKVKDDSIYA
jgi:uncharacterized protein (TIGR02594 family)